MGLMVLVGYIVFRRGLISEHGTKEMSNLLLKIVTPMILISSFQREFDGGLMRDWLIMFGISALTYAVQIIIATLFYRDKSAEHVAENRLSVVLPNCGFLAFPLMQALVGDTGIFLGSTSVIILNILMWTYGSKLFRPKEKLRLKNILTNPGIISVVGGLILFVSPYKLPQPVFIAMDAIGSLNTPLAMIVLGGLLAQTNLKEIFSRACFYKVAFLKQILVPVIMLVLLMIIPMPPDVKLIAFICAATPTATAVGMLSQLYDSDYRFATCAVVITTVVSLVSIPLILSLGKVLLGY